MQVPKVSGSEGPHIGFMLCCKHLKILSKFLFVLHSEKPSGTLQRAHEQSKHGITFVPHSLPPRLQKACAVPISTEFQSICDARQFCKIQSKNQVSTLHPQLNNLGADSLDKLPFKPELALNTERRKWLLGNMNNQGKGKMEHL